MISYFLPEFFYHVKVSNHAQIKEKFLPHIKKSQTSNPWKLCNTKTSFGLANGTNDFLYDKIFLDSLWKAYDDVLDSPLIKESHQYKYPTNSTVDLWFNLYGEGDYQEVHDHSDDRSGNHILYSSVYILEDTSTTGLCFRSSNKLIKRYATNNIIHTKDCEIGEGSLVIFPAYLDHYVLPTNGTRITITGNIMSNS